MSFPPYCQRTYEQRHFMRTRQNRSAPLWSETLKTRCTQQLKKGGLWEGVVQEPLRRALFCVCLCSEVIFSCKSHRNFFQKLPRQCRHFLENPLAKNPKTQLLMHACKRDRKLPALDPQEWSAPERDRNEIRTRYQFVLFEGIEGQGCISG